MTSIPQSAPVTPGQDLPGQDMPEEVLRVRMNCTNPYDRPIWS
jgi:hypothetical protein